MNENHQDFDNSFSVLKPESTLINKITHPGTDSPILPSKLHILKALYIKNDKIRRIFGEISSLDFCEKTKIRAFEEKIYKNGVHLDEKSNSTQKPLKNLKKNT